MSRHKTFAEILAEAKAERRPARVVRPGGFNSNGEFFDPAGNLLTLVGVLTPKQAQERVAQGARLAFEGCGCGGGGGCKPEWIDPAVSKQLAATKPRFVKGHKSPTWIDLWEGHAASVVFAHGDVEWGNALV